LFICYTKKFSDSKRQHFNLNVILTLSKQNVQTADNNKALPNCCCFEAYGKIKAVSNWID